MLIFCNKFPTELTESRFVSIFLIQFRIGVIATNFHAFDIGNSPERSLEREKYVSFKRLRILYVYIYINIMRGKKDATTFPIYFYFSHLYIYVYV